jgi:hypothetical protein
MATAQVNGSALTNNGYGSFLEANNAHGTMKANGTATSNIVESVTTPSPVVDAFASKVVEDTVTVKDYAGKAVSGGVFAHNHVKPISSLITDELAGLSNNSIKTPGNDQDTIRSINKLETLRTRKLTTAIRENKYNRYTNEFDAGYPQASVDTLATDEAAAPTSSVPGELTYMSGAKTPYNDNYKAKTSY